MNVYIYSEGRAPSSDTVLYLPMKEDLLDHSGNNITVTNKGTVSINNGYGRFGSAGTGGWLKVAYNADSRLKQKPFTISLMVKFAEYPGTSGASSTRGMLTGMNIYSGGFSGRNLGMMINNNTGNKYKTRIELLPSGGSTYSNTEFVTDKWYNFIMVISSSTRRLYINGQLDTGCNGNATLNFPNRDLYIGSNPFTSSDASGDAGLNGWMSEYIFESKERSAQDASKYYNQIKNLYH